MEQDVDNGYRTVCSTCLCGDRNLYRVNDSAAMYQMFRLLMYDFAGDRLGELIELEQLVCWECAALLRKFARFKVQVHSAQEHLRVLALSRTQETLDHTYMSQSLSQLEMTTKSDYDKIFFDYTAQEVQWNEEYAPVDSGGVVKNEQYDVAHVVRDNINLDISEHILGVPGIVLDNSISHIVVGEPLGEGFDGTFKGEDQVVSVSQCHVSAKSEPKPRTSKDEYKGMYVTEYMSETEMMAMREAEKLKVQYASSVYKCELCIIGFYTQQQVEDHFLSEHKEKPGHEACRVCYAYIRSGRLQSHLDAHYARYACRLCAHVAHSAKLMALHARGHLAPAPPAAAVHVHVAGGKKKKGQKTEPATPQKPNDLRKLLLKTTIEGYQCLECDMFFKNSRARKNHVARFHREGLQCDHCKKRFVNRTTLATHLKLHEGPPPRAECPVCRKQVRAVQLKYHVRRHESRARHECAACNKVFAHLATYHAHLKYSRAHASEHVFKYPCPMCNKGYPTKEQMQDHFNYQHLGKTAHKCPICDKPIASRANVEKHMMRVHREKKEKPRNHRCNQCGKTFTDKKALTQHEVIHSGERPLSCDICHQTFKQKASLYTHRKRVHKVFPAKRVVEFMDSKPDEASL